MIERACNGSGSVQEAMNGLPEDTRRFKIARRCEGHLRGRKELFTMGTTEGIDPSLVIFSQENR
jgi:hypothetical protein